MSAAAHSRLTTLRGPVLRSVSRSFYLSIRLLPAKLRDPIALAYLLARATDTIADTSDIAASVRTAELARLAGLIQEESSTAPGSFEAFAKLQSDPAEKVLIRALPQCLAWLGAMPSAERDEIRKVLLRINEGQSLDVQRFADPNRVTALPTAADLDRYTYLVAGCVGEFWTNVCFLALPDFSRLGREEMVRLGVEYGKGLQLINILRDVGADLSAGRCYLPADELHSLGVDPAELRAQAKHAQPLLDSWRTRAEQGIAAGIEYACAIRPWRVRLATALPALIGTRTLALLRRAGSEVFEIKIKVDRAEVRRILWRSVATLASPASIRALYRELGA